MSAFADFFKSFQILDPAFSRKLQGVLGGIGIFFSFDNAAEGNGARLHHVNCAKNFLNFICSDSGEDNSGSHA